MVTKETHKMALRAKECLRRAVREELRRKALLGQYVIIARNGSISQTGIKKLQIKVTCLAVPGDAVNLGEKQWAG